MGCNPLSEDAGPPRLDPSQGEDLKSLACLLLPLGKAWDGVITVMHTPRLNYSLVGELKEYASECLKKVPSFGRFFSDGYKTKKSAPENRNAFFLQCYMILEAYYFSI